MASNWGMRPLQLACPDVVLDMPSIAEVNYLIAYQNLIDEEIGAINK